MPQRVVVVEGDPLSVTADVLVSPWTRNWMPWWLLNHTGLQGEIRLRGGDTPYRELARAGRLAPGDAVHTSAGRLRFKGIIHVALSGALMGTSERVVARCVQSATELAENKGYRTLCIPVLGGVSGVTWTRALEVMRKTLEAPGRTVDVTIVSYSDAYARHLRRPYRKAWSGG